MSRKGIFFALFVFLAAVYFIGVSGHGLIDPDEGRYSEIPREMIESGDYVTPRLNYVKYFEKPLLHYWLTAASFKIFGQNEFSSRFIPELMGLLTVLLTYFTARKISRDSSAFSALILGSSVLWFAISRLNITDMTLTFFFTFAMLSYRYWLDGKFTWLLLFYACMAFAVLTKGLIGVVLPGGIAFLHLVFTKKYKLIIKLFNPLAIILFFLITVPVFWLTCRVNPDFFDFFFIREHFLRYTTTIHDRYEPFYFFIPIVIAAFIPWTGLIVNSFMKLFDDDDSLSKSDKIFLAVWFLLPFIFFSFSNSKLIPYILPCMPPIAILSGISLNELNIKNFKIFFITSLIILVPVALTGLLLPSLSNDPDIIAMKYPAGMLGLSLLLFLFAAYRKYILLMCFLAVIAILAASPAFKKVALSGSRQEVSHELNQILVNDEDSIVAAYRDLMQGLSFYLKRRIVIVDDLNELEFGAKAENNSGWFIDSQELKKLCRSNKHVYIVTRKKYIYDLMNDLSDDIKLLHTTGNDYLYVNF